MFTSPTSITKKCVRVKQQEKLQTYDMTRPIRPLKLSLTRMRSRSALICTIFNLEGGEISPEMMSQTGQGNCVDRLRTRSQAKLDHVWRATQRYNTHHKQIVSVHTAVAYVYHGKVACDFQAHISADDANNCGLVTQPLWQAR